MPNANKAKGARYERDVANLCRDQFPDVLVTRAGNILDKGDLHLTWGPKGRPSTIVQCKDVSVPDWRKWLADTEAQRVNSGADHAFLCVKRRGAGGRPPLHLAVMPLDQMLDLIKELELLKESS